MSGFVLGPECAVIFTGADAVKVAEMLADWVTQRERTHGTVLASRRDLAAAAHKAAAGYAAEYRRVLADFGSDAETSLSRLDTERRESPVVPTEWITVPEAAKAMGVSESYVRRLARQGRLRARQTGRGTTWRVDSAGAARWTPGRSAA